jgi:hypothetical protein
MKHLVWRLALVLTATAAFSTSTALRAAPAATAATDDAEAQIAARASASPCAHASYRKRGVAPAGFVRGMALSYAKAYCELKTQPDSVATALAGDAFAARSDALAWYGRAGGSAEQRLRALYALALGEGMRESSGNPSEGWDRSVAHQNVNIAEAGLFQVSFDSIGLSPWLRKLYADYQADPAACRLDVFMAGQKDRHASVIGTGPGADFQRFTKACPAFAVEYAAVMFRVKLQHFGPIRRKEAELLPACEAMLQDIQSLAPCP